MKDNIKKLVDTILENGLFTLHGEYHCQWCQESTIDEKHPKFIDHYCDCVYPLALEIKDKMSIKNHQIKIGEFVLGVQSCWYTAERMTALVSIYNVKREVLQEQRVFIKNDENYFKFTTEQYFRNIGVDVWSTNQLLSFLDENRITVIKHIHSLLTDDEKTKYLDDKKILI
jgi:hypothetical protein